jgi:hypothetical protein
MPIERWAAWQPSLNSMRYLCSTLLFLLLLLGSVAEAKARKSSPRPRGKQSSLKTVRNKQKTKLKPNVYSPKRNRPVLAKKSHWWQQQKQHK